MKAEELRALLTEARASRDFGRFVEAIPFARFLGLSVAMRGDELVTTLRFDPKLVGNSTIPALHGGTMGGLLESAAIFSLLSAPESAGFPKIINITVDYLRSARAVETYAAGVITKQGRRVTTVQAFAWQEDRDKPVASAYAHFLVQDG
jgi:uncharacterized protein (TIGR00369 family)